MTILESAAPTAAVLCKEMVEFGTLDEEKISVSKRIDSIWDILDRTGNKAPDKRLVAHLDLAELIVKAYEKKHKSNGGTENGEVRQQGSMSANVEQGSMNANADDDDIVDGCVVEELEMLPVAI